MYPSDKVRTTISFGYWQIYPDTEFFRRRGLAGKAHHGVDIAPFPAFKNLEIPIIAPVSGVILDCYFTSGYGNLVKICSSEDGDKDNVHYLAHLEKFYCKKGEPVKKGVIIGLMGSTGTSTAKHLHYEVRHLKEGKMVPGDPMRYLT